MPSDVQIFVRFTEPCVFAGEEVRCSITFRNVADLRGRTAAAQNSGWHGRRGSFGHQAFNGRDQIQRSAHNPRLVAATGNGMNGRLNRHKATMSLSIPSDFQPSLPSSRAHSPKGPQRSTHYRHTSTISEFSPNSNVHSESPIGMLANRPARPRHARSSTVQITSGASANSKASTSDQDSLSNSNGRDVRIEPATDSQMRNSSISRSTLSANWPSATSSHQVVSGTGEDQPVTHENYGETLSVADSARSSAEFHSLSNHSQETLASEQPSLASERPQYWDSKIRQHYNFNAQQPRPASVVNLLMGYAQINGNFILDGALVDQSPFEEVKAKGFLGGQAGGGVVGMTKAPMKGGLLGALNLNSISESFSGLIGGANSSSVREMRAVANARAIPLLSTPQSLLFVDLRLEPGDEKSFNFRFRLPKGLPSSHRGKAIKISYNLTVGVQTGSSGRKLHTVRQVNIPLRVFPGVTRDGEIYGHDLMQPHVILQDTAQVSPADFEISEELSDLARDTGTPQEKAKEFLGYVNTLLDKHRRRQSSSGTVDAMSAAFTQRDENTVRGYIDRALLFSNQSGPESKSPNRFEISREGKRVAVILLNRPTHRLGEMIVAAIDFSNNDVLCPTVRATLETTEQVVSSLAVRSEASISRVTRKIYATFSENTLFAKRVVFNPSIPESSTPTFVTTGVSLNWHLKFEFGFIQADEGSEGGTREQADLLEEIHVDERGILRAGIEALGCDTLDVSIPLTVYGDVVQKAVEDNEIVGLSI